MTTARVNPTEAIGVMTGSHPLGDSDLRNSFSTR